MKGRETGIILFLGVIVSFIITAGQLTWFTDLSQIFFLGLVLCYLFGSLGFKFYQNSSELILNKIIEASIIAPLILGIIGLVTMFQNLSDPSSIGPAMAFVMISALTSLLTILICYMLKRESRVENSLLFIAGFLLLLIIFTFFVLLLSVAK